MTCRPDKAAIAGLALLIALAGAPGLAQADRGDAGELIVAANEDLRGGDPVSARAKLDAALAQGVRRRVVAAAMGEALLDEGKLDQAGRWLRPGEFSPSSAMQGYRALSRLERAEGDMLAAGRALDAALALVPEDGALWVDIARLRYAGGEHFSAIEAADRAVQLAPDNPQALLLKGQLVRDSLGVVPAIAWLERAAEAAPEDLVIKGELAATLGEAGEAGRMLALTREILASDPRNARAYYLQAVLAARARDYTLARSLLNRVGKRLDKVPGMMLLEGVVEMALGNHALAAERLDVLVKQQPANLKARDLLARALFLSGEYNYLIERFANEARGEDASPYLQTTVARAYEALDDRRSAALYLELAAAGPGDPVLPVATQGRLGTLLASASYGEAQGLVRGWLDGNPQLSDSLLASGDIDLVRGEAAGAAQSYAQAARVRQTDALFEKRFQALLAAGAMREAVALSQERLTYNPRSPAALRTTAWLSAWSGDWRRARVLYEALERTGAGRDPQLQADLALVRLNTGDAEAALVAARRAYAIQRANPVATQALGVSLVAAQEQPETARALLAKARSLMGDNPLLVQARVKLAEMS